MRHGAGLNETASSIRGLHDEFALMTEEGEDLAAGAKCWAAEHRPHGDVRFIVEVFGDPLQEVPFGASRSSPTGGPCGR
jgi:hypothetical protein